MTAIARTIDRYSGFAFNALKEAWAYRFRLLIWIVYDFVMLAVQYYLWTAVFANSGGSLRGISALQYISYVAIVMVVSRLIACRIDGDIAEQIKDGNISMNLTKPFSYFGMMLSRRIGFSLSDTLALLPIVVVASFMVSGLASNPLVLGAFLLSLVFGYVLTTITFFLLGILAFWITNYWGLFLFKGHIIALFSGEIVALDLLFRLGSGSIPELPIPFLNGETVGAILRGFGIAAYCLPFQAMTYTPSAILTGMISEPRAILLHLLLQAGWILVMAGLTRFVWLRGLRRVTIMGG